MSEWTPGLSPCQVPPGLFPAELRLTENILDYPTGPETWAEPVLSHVSKPSVLDTFHCMCTSIPGTGSVGGRCRQRPDYSSPLVAHGNPLGHQACTLCEA